MSLTDMLHLVVWAIPTKFVVIVMLTKWRAACPILARASEWWQWSIIGGCNTENETGEAEWIVMFDSDSEGRYRPLEGLTLTTRSFVTATALWRVTDSLWLIEDDSATPTETRVRCTNSTNLLARLEYSMIQQSLSNISSCLTATNAGNANGNARNKFKHKIAIQYLKSLINFEFG